MESPKSEIEKLQIQLDKIEKSVDSIVQRNRRVELDKKWETSVTRFLCVTAVTYITMNLILWSIGGPFPPVHAIVPTCGYMLSTLSFRIIKELWIKWS